MLLSREAVDLDSSRTNVEDLHQDIEQSITKEYEQDSQGHRETDVQLEAGQQQDQALSVPEQSIEQVDSGLVPAREDPSRPMEEVDRFEQSQIDSQL